MLRCRNDLVSVPTGPYLPAVARVPHVHHRLTGSHSFSFSKAVFSFTFNLCPFTRPPLLSSADIDPPHPASMPQSPGKWKAQSTPIIISPGEFISSLKRMWSFFLVVCYLLESCVVPGSKGYASDLAHTLHSILYFSAHVAGAQ